MPRPGLRVRQPKTLAEMPQSNGVFFASSLGFSVSTLPFNFPPQKSKGPRLAVLISGFHWDWSRREGCGWPLVPP